MNQKFCKKCGCKLFDENVEYCVSCMPSVDGDKNKKGLKVDNSASDKLATISTFIMIAAVIMCFVGFVICMANFDELSGYRNDPTKFILGVEVLVAGLCLLVVKVFVNSAITITKSAEYYNAQVEEKFEIK